MDNADSLIISKCGYEVEHPDSLMVPSCHARAREHSGTAGDISKSFTAIFSKYNLSINNKANLTSIFHKGPHPESYHAIIFERITKIDEIAKGDVTTFMSLFESQIEQFVHDRPYLLHKSFKINQ